ncbi:unnamed protein product [Fraxinus pennsylvanica]|uniref:Uncharacterized protein n=1 Tax=Fraxinus pennsylvanica TaxID=56036 RepID=A0AAD1ZDE1_9LAMI|nr:unnamed protein product [Fraxinus pennsylvanica]
MRSAHRSSPEPEVSSRCSISSFYTSTASTLCSVSLMSFSQRCELMKPPTPIMQIVIDFIGFLSRSTLPLAIFELRTNFFDNTDWVILLIVGGVVGLLVALDYLLKATGRLG